MVPSFVRNVTYADGEEQRVVFCPDKQRSFEPFMCVDDDDDDDDDDERLIS